MNAKQKGVSLANVRPETLLRFLRCVEHHGGRQARNRIATANIYLLRMNRQYLVRKLVITTALHQKHMISLIYQYCNLEVFEVLNAETLPCDFIRRLQRRLLHPALRTDYKWKRFDKKQNAPVLQFMRDNKIANNGFVNPIRHLSVHNSTKLTHGDIEMLIYLPYLQSISLSNLPGLQNFSFLYHLPFPHNVNHVSLDGCANLSCEPVEITDASTSDKMCVELIASSIADYILRVGEHQMATHLPERSLPRISRNEEILPKIESVDDTKGKEKDTPTARSAMINYHRCFEDLSRLQSLSVVMCDKLDKSLIETVYKHCPVLTNLSLRGCAWVDDASMILVRNMDMLVALDVSRCSGLTDDALKILCYITGSTLESLRNNHTLLDLCAINQDVKPPTMLPDDFKAIQTDPLLCFLYATAKNIRTDIVHLVNNYAMRHNDELLEKHIKPGFSMLKSLNVSFCPFRMMDPRMFSTLLMLEWIIADGIPIYTEPYNIDQVCMSNFQQVLDGKKTWPEVIRVFNESNCFQDTFKDDWTVHNLAIRTLSVGNCTAKKGRCADGSAESFFLAPSSESLALAATNAEKEGVSKTLCVFAKHMSHLQTLNARNTPFFESPLAAVYTLFWLHDNLVVLDLSNAKGITNAVLEAMANLMDGFAEEKNPSKLAVLVFSNNGDIDGRSVSRLLHATESSLEVLRLINCAKVTDVAFLHRKTRKPHLFAKLSSVDVSGCKKLTFKFLGHLLDHKPTEDSVRSLGLADLSNDKFSKSGMTLASHLRKFRKLQFISFDSGHYVNDAILLELHEALASLQGVSLRETPNVSIEQVAYLKFHPSHPIVVIE